MRPHTKRTRSVIADVLNEQMEKFLKRLESQDYAPSGVLHYRRRLSEFCAQEGKPDAARRAQRKLRPGVVRAC